MSNKNSNAKIRRDSSPAWKQQQKEKIKRKEAYVSGLRPEELDMITNSR